MVAGRLPGIAAGPPRVAGGLDDVALLRLLGLGAVTRLLGLTSLALFLGYYLRIGGLPVSLE